MKIENPQRYLQKALVLNLGDTIKLQFKLPNLKSAIYGTFDDLSGEIPLLLKFGEHPISPFYNLSESEQEKIIKSFYSYFSTLDENLDDDGLYKASVCNIVVTLAYLSILSLEPESELFILMVKLIGALIVGDDGIDNEEFMDGINPRIALVKIQKAIQSAQNGDMTLFEKIPLVFPPLEAAWQLLKAFFKGQKDPGSNYYYFFAECYDIITSQLVIFSKNSDVYNDQAWNMICGINKALGMPLEVSAGLQGLKIDRSIREWYPFREMKNCFYSINSGLNDIRGILRDVKYGKVSDSSILSRIQGGKSSDLSDAFYSVLKSVADNYKNLIAFMDLIESTFPSDQNITKYVKIMKTMLDGQAYAYFGFPFDIRYGVCEASIVKV